MLWGMGQMGPVLVSVLFTLNSVTKLNSVKRLCSQTHLDTVVRAPAERERIGSRVSQITLTRLAHTQGHTWLSASPP